MLLNFNILNFFNFRFILKLIILIFIFFEAFFFSFNFPIYQTLIISILFLVLLFLPLFFMVYLSILNFLGSVRQYLKQSLFIFFFFYSLVFFLFLYVFFFNNNDNILLDVTTVSNILLTYLIKSEYSYVDIFSGFPLSFIFYIDVLGVLFLCLTWLLIFLCIFFLWPQMHLEKNMVLYLSQLLLLLVQLQMTFCAANLLTFFIAFESLLIPMILMITIWGSPNRRQANNYLVFYTMISAVPMLLSIIYIYQKFGNLDISYLILISSWTWSEQFWLWLAFFFAFAVKTPMVPVHIWLPKAHVDAPTIGSVILAGLLLKVGLVGFIRILLPLFPDATHFFAPLVSSLATIGVLYSSFITLRQIDMKRIIAYSSVAHMNMAVVSLCSLNPLGLYSTIYLMLSHGFIASGLFFLVGFLYNRFHVRAVAYFGGLATIMPVMTIIFFLFSLANMAFPFTSGFIGEFLLLLSISSTNFFLGFLNATSMLLTTVYTMLLFGRVFLGELKPKFQSLVEFAFSSKNSNLDNEKSFFHYKFSIYDLYYYEFVITIILLFFIFLLGIYPQVLFTLLLQSSNLIYSQECIDFI